MNRAIGLTATLMLGGVGLPAQITGPVSQLNWTSVNVILMSDSTAGVKLFLVTQPQSTTVPYLFYDQVFVPADADAWVQTARSLLMDSSSTGGRPATLVARDSSLLILARERGQRDRMLLAYYPPPDTAETKPLDIRLSLVAAREFLDSLSTRTLASRYDPNAPSPDSGVILAEQIRQLPQMVSAPPVRYPEDLRQSGVAGTVVIQVVVDTTGWVEPKSIKVVSASNRGFSNAAVSMIRRARFRPARINGRAVRVLLQVPVRFTLGHSY